MRKQMMMLAIMMVLVFNSIVVYAAEISIKINGSTITSNVSPFIKNGTTFVPIRFVSESLGAKVDWNSKTKTVTITKENIDKIVIDKPNIVKNTTFVPLRFVAENLDCTVDWNSQTRTVTIKAKDYVEPVDKKQDLIDKYTALSKKARDITEFKSYPVTDYYRQDQIPQSVWGYRIDKIRFADINVLPITLMENDIYNIELENLDDTKVLAVTMRVKNREVSMPLIYASKEKGLLVKRDTHINGVREDIVKIPSGFIVKHKYVLPTTKDGISTSQIEYFVFYDSANKDSIAIKNPYKK